VKRCTRRHEVAMLEQPLGGMQASTWRPHSPPILELKPVVLKAMSNAIRNEEKSHQPPRRQEKAPVMRIEGRVPSRGAFSEPSR
jgi:hypothetical protein